jgi:hypothetical protein
MLEWAPRVGAVAPRSVASDTTKLERKGEAQPGSPHLRSAGALRQGSVSRPVYFGVTTVMPCARAAAPMRVS